MSKLLDNLDEIELQKASFIIPKNIKKNVKVLGVTGSLIGVDTSDATAKAKDIREGLTAYVDGELVTGNLQYEPDNFSLNGINDDPITVELKENDNNKYIQLKYKRSGADTIVGGSANVTANLHQETMAIASGITADKIKKDEVILGVTGSFEGGTDISDATAVAKNILVGKTAYISSGKVTGTMAENGDNLIFPVEEVISKTEGHYNYVKVPSATETGTYRNCMGIASMILNGQEIPSQYEQLEYLESTGTQYIKLDFPQTGEQMSNYMFDMYLDASFTNIPQSGFCGEGIGSMASILTLYRAMFYVGISNGKFAFSNCDDSDNATTIPADTLRHLFFVQSGSSSGDRGFYIDGVQVSSEGAITEKCNFKFKYYLFGYENDNGFRGDNIRIYRLIIKRHGNSNAYYDFIPAKLISTGEVGMYDKVANRFYTNMGTGDFLYSAF